MPRSYSVEEAASLDVSIGVEIGSVEGREREDLVGRGCVEAYGRDIEGKIDFSSGSGWEHWVCGVVLSIWFRKRVTTGGVCIETDVPVPEREAVSVE